MSYTHDRDITLEGWIVHTSQANAKGTIKEHRNPILESRCKSKRGMGGAARLAYTLAKRSKGATQLSPGLLCPLCA